VGLSLILWLMSRFPPMMDVFQLNITTKLANLLTVKWRQYLFNTRRPTSLV